MARVKANEFNRLFVYGYIRDIESSLNLSNIIPLLVIHQILIFYYIHDYIEKARKDCLVISNDKLTITNIETFGFYQGAIYLNQWIESLSNSLSYTWTFKINKLKDWIIFSLISQEETWLTAMHFIPKYAPCYAFSNKGHIYKLEKSFYPYRIIKQNKPARKDADAPPPKFPDTLKFSSGDIISITLNLKQHTLSCKINENKSILIFDKLVNNDNIKWKLALQIVNLNDSVTLLNFYSHS